MATIPDELAARIVAALETIAETIVTFQQQFEERERKFAEAKAKKRDFGDKPFGAKKPFGRKPRFDDDNDGGYGSDNFGDDERPKRSMGRKSFGDKPAGRGKSFGDKPASRGEGRSAGPKGRDRFAGAGGFRDFDGPKKGGKKAFGKKKY